MLGCNRSERKRNIIVFDHQQWHAHIQAIHIHTIAYTHIHEQIIEGVEDNNNFTINGIGEVWFKQMWTPNTYTNTISHPKKKNNNNIQMYGYKGMGMCRVVLLYHIENHFRMKFSSKNHIPMEERKSVQECIRRMIFCYLRPDCVGIGAERKSLPFRFYFLFRSWHR